MAAAPLLRMTMPKRAKVCTASGYARVHGHQVKPPLQLAQFA